MIASIETARRSLRTTTVALFAGFTVCSAVFLFAVFGERNQLNMNLVHITLFMGGVGLISGFHQQYRSGCGSASGLVGVFYFVFIIEFMLVGGISAMAVWIAGAPELRILAVITSALTLMISMMLGLPSKADGGSFWRGGSVAYAKEHFTKQINYTDKTFKSLPLKEIEDNSVWQTHGVLIACVGITNVPLAFLIFTGDRLNAVYFALPLAVGTFACLNVKVFGRVLFNLILLRRLEASLGYRFINADYEEIQDLRRTFLLSRWLMKDYIKPTADKAKPIKPNKRAA